MNLTKPWITICWAALVGSIPAGAQFTAITGTPPVNDGGHSFAVAWADYDSDGYPDLFVGNWTSANCLYHNNGDGTFSKVTTTPLSSDFGALASAWADYDGDGDLDVYLANVGTGPPVRRNSYYRNDGDGNFTRITSGDHVTDLLVSQSAAPGDYDGDGDLDLYVVNHAPPSGGGGIYNQFFQNDGAAGFTELNQDSLGMDKHDRTSVSWADYNNDGHLDLYVASGMYRSALMQNLGSGLFQTIADGVLAADSGSCGFSWGDYDNDRDLDVLATYTDGQPNRLYRNLGGGEFEIVADQCIVTDVSFSEGACWGDYDNDGDLDLFAANNQTYQPKPNLLYANNGDGTFTRVTSGCVATDFHASSGAAWGDYDRDGDLDLYVTNCGGGDEDNVLYRNDGNGNHWISIHCIAAGGNVSAIGTKVYAKATLGGSPRWQMREISGQTGFHGQCCMHAHFGLGDAAVIDTLEIHWSHGPVQIMTGVAADQFMVITQSSAGIPHHDRYLGFGFDACRPNPFRDSIEMDFRLRFAQRVSISIFDAAGRLVTALMEGREFGEGRHRVVWGGRRDSGRKATPGIYFCSLETGDLRAVERLILLE